MMTEKTFFEAIKERTGWDIGDPTKDRAFGFIMGARIPYVPSGMVSVERGSTFGVWKRKDNVGVEQDIQFNSSEDALNKVCEFLNKPFPIRDNNISYILVGEKTE